MNNNSQITFSFPNGEEIFVFDFSTGESFLKFPLPSVFSKKFLEMEKNPTKKIQENQEIQSKKDIVPLCKFWKQGKCRFGDKCIFRHTYDECASSAKQSNMTCFCCGKKGHHISDCKETCTVMICPHWFRGSCKYGGQCKRRHTLDINGISEKEHKQKPRLW
jgi:hypothetical protein